MAIKGEPHNYPKKVSVRMISDPNSILHMERVWNTLVNRSCETPFLLNGFVQQFIESNRNKGWTPLVLVISAYHKIVGIAPLMTKKKFGVPSVKFIQSSWSSDFIFCDEYLETCTAHTIDFLFKTLKCKFAEFSLPGNSRSLEVLKQQCKANRIHCRAAPEMGHRILPINCTWTEFETLKRRNFRQQFKKIRRKLDRAGSWKIVCVDENNESDAIRKILDVERMSWKEAWRLQRGEKVDEDLVMILKSSQHTVRIEPKFKWSVWFLELNNQTLAYYLVLEYKEIAFMTKTSYDERYKRLNPGAYIRYSVIRELFNKRQVKSIDFLSDFPHQRTWTSTCQPRVRALLSKGVLPTIARSVFVNKYLMKSRGALFGTLPFNLAP